MNEPPPHPTDYHQQQHHLLRKAFNPIEHGLDATWRLTKFSDLKG